MYIGVDTHKKTHLLVAIDARGQVHATQTVANTPQGWVTALEWAGDYRGACCWGIENSGSLGKGFAQFLLAEGETDVREVSPQRTAQYRRRGRTRRVGDCTADQRGG